MTFKIGWSGILAAGLLLLVLLGAVFYMWRRSVQLAERWDQIDLERARRISDLEEEAKIAAELAAEKSKLADSYRDQRDGARALLEENRRRLQQIRRNEQGRAEDPEEERWILFESINLLETNLRLAELEALELRNGIGLLRVQNQNLTEALELAKTRIGAYQKRLKQTRRRQTAARVGFGILGAATITLAAFVAVSP